MNELQGQYLEPVNNLLQEERAVSSVKCISLHKQIGTNYNLCIKKSHTWKQTNLGPNTSC